MTQNILGTSCSRRSITNSLNTLAKQLRDKLEVFLHEAYTNEWFLVLIIVDYTTVHTHHRPISSKSSSSNSMYTIVVKAFKDLKAVKIPKESTSLTWNQLTSCLNFITSSAQMCLLANTYSSVMPRWLTNQFFFNLTLHGIDYLPMSIVAILMSE